MKSGSAASDTSASGQDSPQPVGQQGESRSFVLPPLPSVAPAAFDLPRLNDASLLSTSSSSSRGWGGRVQPGFVDSESDRSSQLRHDDSSSDDDSEAPSMADDADWAVSTSPTRPTSGFRGSLNSAAPEVTSAGASSSRGVASNEPLQPTLWNRSTKASPDLVRSYSTCAVVWCIVDGEGIVGLFPVVIQLQWWHSVHRLVDSVVKQTDFCQAEGGQRGFCIVPGAGQGEPGHDVCACIDFAVKLMALLQQVQLPNGNPLSVRIGIHCGAAADGLVGAGRSLHYQMVGPTVETANQLALFAPFNRIVVSDAVVRLLDTRACAHSAAEFVKSHPVPLTYSREIFTHTYSGALPQVSLASQAFLKSLRFCPAFSADRFEGPSSSCQDSAAESRLPYADSSIWPENERRAQDIAEAKHSERLAWSQQQFQELYQKKASKVCCFANLMLACTMLLGHLSQGAAAIAMQPLSASAAFLLVILSCAAAAPGRYQGLLSGTARVGRVVLLLWTHYLRLKDLPVSLTVCLSSFGALSIPMVGVSLLEGNLLPAHAWADAICLGLAIAAFPFICHSSGLPTGLLFTTQAILGVALPSVVLAYLQQQARRDFAISADQYFQHRGSRGEGVWREAGPKSKTV